MPPSAVTAAAASSAATPMSGRATPADAAHLLARLTFGARPGEAQAVARTGLAAWLDAQLAPARLPDPAGDAALAPFRDALAPFADLEDAAEREAAAMVQDGAADKKARNQAKRELLLETQMTAIARHVASERAVLEVLTDFWTNHFSVSLQKGKVRYLAADFVERAVRPHALGKFSDLLLATARHPAMLIYLDNAQSVAPPPGSKQAQRGRGLNENYARELLELHTVGVHAGYSQDDVVAVARILTGWGVVDGAFAFRPRLHADGDKRVLGQRFAPAGEQEGVQLLGFLARHPATIEHVCRQLCIRLVADAPPRDAIAAATAAWRRSDGEVAAVVRAIAGAPAFWRAEHRGGKIKSPLELAVSAVRAVAGEVDGTGLAKLMVRLGQPPLLAPAPTGYADASAAWLSTAGALERMDFALGLAADKLPGVRLALDQVLPLPAGEPIAEWRVATLRRLDAMVAGGLAPATRAVIERWLATPSQPAQARTLGLALTLASPEFQRQ
jgi:uncharacterized protein (DUF1800 family)